MKIEKVNPIYKSTFNNKQNSSNKNNKNKQNKEDKTKFKETPAAILEISAEGRKKLEEDFER